MKRTVRIFEVFLILFFCAWFVKEDIGRYLRTQVRSIEVEKVELLESDVAQDLAVSTSTGIRLDKESSFAVSAVAQKDFAEAEFATSSRATEKLVDENKKSPHDLFEVVPGYGGGIPPKQAEAFDEGLSYCD